MQLMLEPGLDSSSAIKDTSAMDVTENTVVEEAVKENDLKSVKDTSLPNGLIKEEKVIDDSKITELNKTDEETPPESSPNPIVDDTLASCLLKDDVMVMIADFDKDNLNNERESIDANDEIVSETMLESNKMEIDKTIESINSDILENEKMDVSFESKKSENITEGNKVHKSIEIVQDNDKTETVQNLDDVTKSIVASNVSNNDDTTDKTSPVEAEIQTLTTESTPELTDKLTDSSAKTSDRDNGFDTSDDSKGLKKSTDINNSEKTEIPTTCLSPDDDDDIVLVDDSVKNGIKDKLSQSKNLTSEAEKESDLNDVKGNIQEKCAAIDKDENVGKISNNKAELIYPLQIMNQIKPTLGAMSREEIEEFCIVKMVESISGRSALSDLRMKLKTYEKSMEEWRKKVIALNKQNKDLQIVLKTVCEEQQKKVIERPTPIKITRSVGLQVGYPNIRGNNNLTNNKTPEGTPPAQNTPPPLAAIPPTFSTPLRRGRQPKSSLQTKPSVSSTSPNVNNSNNNTSSPNKQTPAKKNNAVPTPRLVPATAAQTNMAKSNPTSAQPSPANNSVLKSALMALPSEPTKTVAEKRPAIQSIDLTDDEPPAKQAAIKSTNTRAPQQALRPVNTQTLTNPSRVPGYTINTPHAPNAAPGPRQVFIPIASRNQPGASPETNMAPRKQILNKSNAIRPTQRYGQGVPIPIRPNFLQHPAPLPQSVNDKQLMSGRLKWIPPRPSLKIAKVDNGIVISWEMEDFSESQHEVIASYQIFAYQEAATQPSTDLWKKIGDVKALPLPMACTLTHFMAGFKYYFAVRAVDVHRRVGPFSAPGNIILVNSKPVK